MVGQQMLSGVHRTLKDPDTTWKDKIKLARFTWSSTQCFLPNKQQVLLDWVCNALANQNKLSLPDDLVPTLWQYLYDILHSRQITTESLTIRDSLYPVLCDCLSLDNSHVAMGTGCLHIILQSSSLCRSLTSKYDVMVDLLSALLQLATRCLETGNTVKDSTLACVHDLLKKFTASHRQKQLQANKKAYAGMYERLLIPALGLYTSCDPSGDQSRDQTKDVNKQIQELITMAIFNKDMCEIYCKYLTLDRDAIEAKDVHLLAHFKDIDKMMQYLQDTIKKDRDPGKVLRNRACAGMPILYTIFTASYKPSAEVRFAMFKKLCGIMGISPDAKDSGIAVSTTCDWTQVLLPLEQMLRIVYDNDTYDVAVDNAEGQPKFQWLYQLLQLILTKADRSSPSFFKCLHLLLELNHLIIEKELTLVFNVSLLISSHPHGADIPVEESRTEFLGSLMRTYAKLRQFDKLLECMMASFQLDNKDSESTEGGIVFFNPGFVHRFCQCIQELPPGLTLDLWKLFVDGLVNSYISKLATDPEPPKKKRKSLPKTNLVNWTSFEQVAVTFHLFLTSAQVADTSVTKAMMNRLETLVEDTQRDVLDVLHEICQSGKHKVNEHLLFATLLLTNTMGEMQLILLQHTKYGTKHTKDGNQFTKYGNSESGDDGTEHALTVLRHASITGHLLHSQSEGKVQDMLSIYEETVDRGSMRLRHIMHLLRIQQMRAALLYIPIDDNIAAIMQKYCDTVLSTDISIDSGVMEPGWDGQISSITNQNYIIAYLHMLSQTFPIWLPYASHHTEQIASLLMQSSIVDYQDGNMTLSSVAQSLLQSDVCMESKDLQTTLLSAGLKNISDMCVAGIKSSNNLVPRCGQLLSVLFKECDDPDERWESMEDVGQQLRTLLNGGYMKKTSTSGDLVKSVQNTLQVFGHLPLTYLLPSNHDKCLLGLVITDILITGWVTSKCDKQGLEILGQCRRLQITILKSMKSTGLLKYLPVDSVLSCIITTHTQIWQDINDAPIPSRQEDAPIPSKLETDYEILDDITQQLIAQWLQKAADRGSQERAVLINAAEMVKTNLVGLVNAMASGGKKISLENLHQCIPLLSTSMTILQRGNTGGDDSSIKSLQTFIQDCLKRTRFDTDDVMHGVMVASIAKCGVALMGFHTATNQGADNSEDPVAMETDDGDVNKNTRRDALKLYQDMLHPVLLYVLKYMQRTRRLDSLLGSHVGRESLDERTTHHIQSCLSFVSAVCDFSVLYGDLVEEDTHWMILKQLLSVMSNQQLQDKAMSSVSSVFMAMTEEQFQESLEHNIRQLGTTEVRPDSVASLQACVLTWQVMPNCNLTEGKHKILQSFIAKVLVCLQCLIVEASRDWCTSGNLVVAILQTIAAMMASHKKFLHPKQAMQTLQVCQTIQFTTVPHDLFVAVFSTMYLLHKSLLQVFPQTVMNCIAAYQVSVQHMLRGIMRRSHQGLLRDECLGDQELFGCAENMERLLTQLSTHDKHVGKFVILLISEYISELQKGTLYPFVKRALVVGIYNLVDVCDEKALALMQATLPPNVKEIYTEFYSDYKKYHKYKGKV